MKNKILPALLSLGIALGIWLYVVTVVSPNSDKSFSNIPVVTQNEIILQERGLMITNIDVTSVSLQLGGSRSDLNNLHNSNITVAVDLSKIFQAGIHELPCDVTFSDSRNPITILNKTPGSVSVTVEERISKPVPVSVEYDGSVAEDFVADKENKVLSSNEINVTGPKSVLDKIAMAQIVVDLKDRSESISENYTYTLCDQEGQPVDAQMVSTDVAEINLTLKIMRMKEIQLLISVIDGGGATKENCNINLEPKTIWVSGSDNLLENFESLEIGTINLLDIPEDQVLTFPIKLPEGIADETGVTEATVTVQFPNLATKVFTLTEFSVVNVPAGYKVDLMTKALEVKVRGPKDKIEALTAESLKITADFSNTEMGAVKVKATITCDVPEIGEVGTYTVSATVNKVED